MKNKLEEIPFSSWWSELRKKLNMLKSTIPSRIMFVSSKIGTRNALYKNITDLKQERALLFLHDVKSVANMLYPKNKVSSPNDCWKISITAIIGASFKKKKKNLSLELFVKK